MLKTFVVLCERSFFPLVCTIYVKHTQQIMESFSLPLRLCITVTFQQCILDTYLLLKNASYNMMCRTYFPVRICRDTTKHEREKKKILKRSSQTQSGFAFDLWWHCIFKQNKKGRLTFPISMTSSNEQLDLFAGDSLCFKSNWILAKTLTSRTWSKQGSSMSPSLRDASKISAVCSSTKKYQQ